MNESQGPIEFACLEITQPIGIFYVGVIGHLDLINISRADVRRIQERDVEKHLGMERPLSPTRVAELTKYVNVVDAAFPTSVILAVESKHAEYDSSKSTLRIDRQSDIAKIIDGQHRIAGLEGFDGEQFQMSVTVFIDMDIEDQAMVFSTINLKQTKVSKSLSYDLYEYAKSRSPQKTCHNIAKLLNSKDKSPFKDRIKILGRATGKPDETLTQAAFVDRLIQHISQDPMVDRDLLKRRKHLNRPDEDELRKVIFRNLFIDEKDAEIARNLWNYFSAVCLKWPRAWSKSRRGNILNRTTGFGALMKFLRPTYLRLKGEKDIVAEAQYLSVLDRVQLSDEDFTPTNYKPGSSGESELYKVLLTMTDIVDERF